MPPRKQKVQEVDPNAPSLQEILSDSSDTSRSFYAGADSLSILRLIHTVSALGGMVTFWRDGNNKRLCISLRVWNQPASYNVNTVDDLSSVTEAVVSKLSKYLSDKKLPPPPPPTPLQLVPTPKK